MMNISNELFTNFNEVVYYDEPHEYYLDNNQKLISVTTLISKFEQEFDEEYWLDYKSKELDIDKESLRKQWRRDNEYGKIKGSVVHEFNENYLNNKVFPYPEEKVIKYLGDQMEIFEDNNQYIEYVQKVKTGFEISTEQFKNFYKDSYGKLIPIKSEFIVYDKEYMIGGMVDQLFYNKKHDIIQVFDHKTNKAISKENKYQKLKYCLNHLDDCEFNKYSVQLSTYKHIIEKNTNIKLGDSYIVWCGENNTDYEIIKCGDMLMEVDLMLNYYKNNIL